VDLFIILFNNFRKGNRESNLWSSLADRSDVVGEIEEQILESKRAIDEASSEEDDDAEEKKPDSGNGIIGRLRRFSTASAEYPEAHYRTPLSPLTNSNRKLLEKEKSQRLSIGVVTGVLGYDSSTGRKGVVLGVDSVRPRPTFVKSTSQTNRSAAGSAAKRSTFMDSAARRTVEPAVNTKFLCISSYSRDVPAWTTALLALEPGPGQAHSAVSTARHDDSYVKQRFSSLSQFMQRHQDTIKMNDYFRTRVDEESKRNFLNIHTCKGLLEVRDEHSNRTRGLLLVFLQITPLQAQSVPATSKKNPVFVTVRYGARKVCINITVTKIY
jgi:hypothetical protein